MNVIPKTQIDIKFDIDKNLCLNKELYNNRNDYTLVISLYKNNRYLQLDKDSVIVLLNRKFDDKTISDNINHIIHNDQIIIDGSAFNNLKVDRYGLFFKIYGGATKMINFNIGGCNDCCNPVEENPRNTKYVQGFNIDPNTPDKINVWDSDGNIVEIQKYGTGGGAISGVIKTIVDNGDGSYTSTDDKGNKVTWQSKNYDNEISELQNKKANKSDLDSVNQDVEQQATAVKNLNDNKADKTAVETINGNVSQNATDIEALKSSKADKAEIPDVSGIATNASSIAENKTAIDGKIPKNSNDVLYWITNGIKPEAKDGDIAVLNKTKGELEFMNPDSHVKTVGDNGDNTYSSTNFDGGKVTWISATAKNVVKALTNLTTLAGENGKYLKYDEPNNQFVLVDATTQLDPADEKLVKSEIDNKLKSALASLNAKIDNKLDTDVGNVILPGLVEKLVDAKVAFKADIPNSLRTPYKKGYIEVQENTPVTIPQDVTNMTIALQSTNDGQTYNFTLPDMTTLPHLEELHIRLIESQVNGGERGQFVIQAFAGQTVGGSVELVLNNISLKDFKLEPNLTTSNWDDFFGAEEKEEVDTSILISDEYGASEKTNHIQLDRGLKINKGSHNVLYDDPEDDEFIVDSQTEEPLQMATKIGLEPNMLKQLAGNDGFYATLENPTELNQAKDKDKGTTSRVFIDYVVLDTLGGVQIDRNTKTYGIQELDMLDPNVSGGEAYVVALNISLKGNATEDFTFKVQLNNMLTNLPITDSNGSVYEVSKSYKKGDKLGDLIIYGVDVAKGIDQMYIQTWHNNTTDGIIMNDKENGNTSIVFQELTTSNKTGKYINQFMMDNDIKFKWNHQYLGDSMFNLKYLITEDCEPTAVNVGNMSYDGITVFTTGMIKHSVKNGMMTLESDGQIVSFGLGKVFDVESSKELENSDLIVKDTLADPTNAVRVSLMGYNGNHLMRDNQIITGYNNGTPVMDTGWTIIESIQINENPQNTVNAYAHTFSVPMSGYNNYAIFTHTADAQSPNKITFQNFEISSDLNKNVWTMTAPFTVNQMMYKYSTDKFVLDEVCSKDWQSLRYTINAKPTPVPIGIIKSGNALLKKVKIWTDSGYDGEGGLEALTDMELTIDYQTYIDTLLIGEKAKGNQTISFYIAKNQADWKNPVVGQPSMTNVLEFDPTIRDEDLSFTGTITLKKGDKIACYMSANVDDGAYIQATSGKRLYEVVCTAKEVVKTK